MRLIAGWGRMKKEVAWRAVERHVAPQDQTPPICQFLSAPNCHVPRTRGNRQSGRNLQGTNLISE